MDEMETAGRRMAELSFKSSLTDEELGMLLKFYPGVIGFLEVKGDKLAAHYLRMEYETLKTFEFNRKVR